MKEQKLTEIEVGAIDEAREFMEPLPKVLKPLQTIELRRDRDTTIITTYALERAVSNSSGSSARRNPLSLAIVC